MGLTCGGVRPLELVSSVALQPQPNAAPSPGASGWLDQAVGSFGTCSCAEMQPGMCLFAFAGSSVKAPKPATNGASAMMKRAVRVCISAQEGEGPPVWLWAAAAICKSG